MSEKLGVIQSHFAGVPGFKDYKTLSAKNGSLGI
jgi:hypothetical protein